MSRHHNEQSHIQVHDMNRGHEGKNTTTVYLKLITDFNLTSLSLHWMALWHISFSNNSEHDRHILEQSKRYKNHKLWQRKHLLGVGISIYYIMINNNSSLTQPVGFIL